MSAPSPASPVALAAALRADGEPTRVALIAALASADKAEAEQAARTLKKLAEADPALLHPQRRLLLEAADHAWDVRVQWNLTIVLGLLPLTGRDRALAIDLFFRRVQHPSGLNRTFALQALINVSADDPALRRRLLPIVHDFEKTGTPAMQARARRLLKKFA